MQVFSTKMLSTRLSCQSTGEINYLSFTAKEHKKCVCAILTTIQKADVPFPLQSNGFIFGYKHKI